MERIRNHLSRKFPGDGNRAQYRQFLERQCEEFVNSGFADSKFIVEMTSGSEAKFWSALSEAFVFNRLRRLHIPERNRVGAGPDFLIQHEGLRIWIEVICPEPSNIPSDFLEFAPGARSFPHNEILLRYTSAIADKARRLIECSGETGGRAGYLQSGVVGHSDAYVIAINACRLRNGPFSSFEGVSQFPVAVEAVFPIGALEIRLERRTLNVVDSGHSSRFHIRKTNGAPVSTHMFMDPEFTRVSAIWAMDLNGPPIFGSPQPSALILNPIADNPIPRGVLPADTEYEARQVDDEHYTLTVHETRRSDV